MRTLVIVAAGLMLSLGPALAQAPSGMTNETTSNKPVVPAVPPEAAAKATTPGGAKLTLNSSDQQRIRAALTLAPVQAVDDTAMSFAPGVTVPGSVALAEIPADLADMVALRDLRFFAGRTDFFLVEPQNRTIAAIVPKNTGL